MIKGKFKKADLHIGDTIKVLTNEYGILTECDNIINEKDFYKFTKYEGKLLAINAKNEFPFCAPGCIIEITDDSLNSYTIAENISMWPELKNWDKLLRVSYVELHYIAECICNCNKTVSALQIKYGYNCCKCNLFNPDAIVNSGDKYICYNCR
jgi:hypothetical protein